MSDHRATGERPDGTLDFPPENVIPPAVRRQAERAAQLQAEAAARAGKTPPAAAQPEPPAQQPEPATVVQPPAQAAPPPPATHAQPVGQPTPKPAGGSDDWQQKFFTLKGKYDAEVPALNIRARNAEGEVVRLNGVVQELTGRINNLETMIASRAPGAPQATAPRPVNITDEDREQYGEELIARAQAWAEDKLGPEIAQLKAQLTQLSSTSAAEQARRQESDQVQVRQRVLDHLDATMGPGHGDWRIVNDSPEFIEWLKIPAQYSSVPKHNVLTTAFEAGNASLVAKMFQDFIEHTVQASQAPTHTGQDPAGKVPLETLAAPGRGKAASPGAPNAKRNWSQAQIAEFYGDVRKGKYRDNPAEKERIERDIFAAPAEGRLV